MTETGEMIIYLLIATVIAIRLRNILGKVDTTNFNNSNINTEQDSQSADEEDVITLCTSEYRKEYDNEEMYNIIADKANKTTIFNTIQAIKEKDGNFILMDFMQDVEKVYDIIIQAFDKNDQAALRELTSDQVFTFFVNKITSRQQQEQTQETTVVSMDSKTIYRASLKSNVAEIGVKFVSKQISLLKDTQGNIIKGDKSRSDIVEDAFVFRRDITSHSPAWKIISINEDIDNLV